MQRYSSGTDRPFWRRLRTIQPDRLAAAFKDADDGLPAPFLYCWPKARPFARPGGTVNVSRATEALCKLTRLETSVAEDGSPVPVFVNATEEAAEALTDFAREMQAQERQAGGLMIGVLGKARGYALRVAVVLEYLPWAWHGDRPEPTVISGNAMMRAIELMRSYFLPMASRVLGDAAITQQERDARALAKWIAAECDLFALSDPAATLPKVYLLVASMTIACNVIGAGSAPYWRRRASVRASTTLSGSPPRLRISSTIGFPWIRPRAKAWAFPISFSKVRTVNVRSENPTASRESLIGSIL
jgi:hypothetical protein